MQRRNLKVHGVVTVHGDKFSYVAVAKSVSQRVSLGVLGLLPSWVGCDIGEEEEEGTCGFSGGALLASESVAQRSLE